MSIDTPVISIIEILALNHFASYTTQIYQSQLSGKAKHDKQGELWFNQNELDTPYILKTKSITVKKNTLKLKNIVILFPEQQNNILYAKSGYIKNKLLILNKIHNIEYGKKLGNSGDARISLF